MSDYPHERDDQPVPGDDPSSVAWEELKARCHRCPHCGGNGFATVFAPAYRRIAVERICEDDRGPRLKLLRTVAYCSCLAGERLSTLHKNGDITTYRKIPFFSTVAAGVDPNWQVDDPTAGELTITQGSQLPRRLQQALRRYREE